METAIVNQSFVFQVLFTDSDNNSLSVNNPTITVFTFSSAGVKLLLAEAKPMVAVTPAETGRYVYVYDVTSSFVHGDMIYADVTGSDPSTGKTYRHNIAVSVIAQPLDHQGLCSGFVG